MPEPRSIRSGSWRYSTSGWLSKILPIQLVPERGLPMSISGRRSRPDALTETLPGSLNVMGRVVTHQPIILSRLFRWDGCRNELWGNNARKAL